MEQPKTKKVLNAFAIGIAVVLVLYVISLFVPVLWALMTTLKSDGEFEGGFDGLAYYESNKL